MLKAGYINLTFVGHTIAGCAYMTAENIHSVDLSDKHVIYTLVNHDRSVPQDRGYIEFCDSTFHTIRATEVLPYEKIEEIYLCDMECAVYNFCKGDVVAVLPRPTTPPFQHPPTPANTLHDAIARVPIARFVSLEYSKT